MNNEYEKINSASINRAEEEHPGSKDKIISAQKTMPVDIINLCKAFDDISVFVSTGLPKVISGAIHKTKDGFAILCNGNEPETRQRFTLAHELAHYLLHYNSLKDDYPENVLLRGGLTNQQEVEANKLAASILMPFGAINKYIETRGGDFRIKDMASFFSVSTPAMAIRLGIPMDI